jgi:hypothetical protein
VQSNGILVSGHELAVSLHNFHESIGSSMVCTYLLIYAPHQPFSNFSVSDDEKDPNPETLRVSKNRCKAAVDCTSVILHQPCLSTPICVARSQNIRTIGVEQFGPKYCSKAGKIGVSRCVRSLISDNGCFCVSGHCEGNLPYGPDIKVSYN